MRVPLALPSFVCSAKYLPGRHVQYIGTSTVLITSAYYAPPEVGWLGR